MPSITAKDVQLYKGAAVFTHTKECLIKMIEQIETVSRMAAGNMLRARKIDSCAQYMLLVDIYSLVLPIVDKV